VEIYTHGHHESVLRSHRWRTVDNSAAYLLPRLVPGVDVLDVGCGPGTITDDIAGRVAPGRVVGVDAALDILRGAPNRAAASVYALPFDDATFDVVHAHQVLQHLADPVAALREMARVCTPGTGVIAARDADYAAFTWHPADPLLDRWLDVYRTVATQNGGEPDAGRHLLAWANAAGLADVTASASVWCFATPDDRAWWGGMWSERILATERGVATPEELTAMAAAWRRWADQDDGWFAVLHGEVLARPAP
jgi:SAM-dependent methyltransferase